MRFSRAANDDRRLLVNITPMIDVVFLLIIFFMTTAQFARLTRAEVDLPLEPGERSLEPEEPGLVVNVTAAGTILVSDREVSLDELRRVVQDEIVQQSPDRPERTKLLLRVDRNARAEALNRVITMLKESGVGFARVATEVP